jgi:1,4-alpha-glucan branching enzyme/maltooligosyltrehalose trehalohydrolase
VRSALALRRSHIAPRQHLLLTGEHSAQRVGATGLRVCWRYADGQALLLELNLGAQPLHVVADVQPLAEGRELLRHAWPEGTAEDLWPAWAARWSSGRASV